VVFSFHHCCDFGLSLFLQQLLGEVAVHSFREDVGKESEIWVASQNLFKVANRAKLGSRSRSLALKRLELNCTDSLDRSNLMGGTSGVGTSDVAASSIACMSQAGGRNCCLVLQLRREGIH
jgi:hypothetical protein